ncbi:MAG: hypothetical protein M1834_004842 [Cirrosporium novae-zelandiae]|nr:MAG: hypothetical protein M1834_004842 [Cirrosporium novae-zelandiae]
MSSPTSETSSPAGVPGDAIITIDGTEKQDPGNSSSEGITPATLVEGSIRKRLSRLLAGQLQKIPITAAYVSSSIIRRLRPIENPNENGLDIQRIDSHPLGYPRLAAFINSDDNFMMCRRFGFLHTRVLLYRQDELRELEDKLVRLDKADEEEYPIKLKSREMDEAHEPCDRKDLIQEIDDKLKQYDELVVRCKTFASLKKTRDRDYNSLKFWISNNKPLAREESEFINCDEDFISLAEAPEGVWFDGFIEDCLEKLPCRQLTKLLFSSPAQWRKTDDSYVRFYSKARIDMLVRLMICILACAILMAPVAVLYTSNVTYNASLKIIIILLFTLLFCVALCLFTKARRQEVFAATAADDISFIQASSSISSKPIKPPKRRNPTAATAGPSTARKPRQSKLAKENNITAQQESDIKEAFSLFAQRHKDFPDEREGVVPILDVRRALIALGLPPPTPPTLTTLLQTLDPTSTSTSTSTSIGYATYPTFLTLCALTLQQQSQTPESQTHEVQTAYSLFTAGGEGPITLAHLKRVARLLREDVGEELLRDMILEANGGAGVGRGVGRGEFEEVMRKAGVFGR